MRATRAAARRCAGAVEVDGAGGRARPRDGTVDRRRQRRRCERSLLHHLQQPPFRQQVRAQRLLGFGHAPEGHHHRSRPRLQRLQHRVVPGLTDREHAISQPQREIVPEALDHHAAAGARLQRVEVFGIDPREHAPGAVAQAAQRAGGDRGLEQPLTDRAAASGDEDFFLAGVCRGLGYVLNYIAGVMQLRGDAAVAPKLRSKRARRGSPCTSRWS